MPQLPDLRRRGFSSGLGDHPPLSELFSGTEMGSCGVQVLQNFRALDSNHLTGLDHDEDDRLDHDEELPIFWRSPEKVIDACSRRFRRVHWRGAPP